MGSEAKEMKYRRRARASEPEEYEQCGGDRGGGAVDWAALKRQDPAELLRMLDEIRNQITRSCEIGGPTAPPQSHRVARRAVSMRPSHADPPPPPPPEYHRSGHASRYGPPPGSYDHLQRSLGDERYGRYPSGRFRQPQQRPEGQWEGYGYSGGQSQGSCHRSSCQCAQCVQSQRAAAAPQVENIPMARFLAGQQRASYQFDRSGSILSEYDRKSVASSLYSHLSMSKRRMEYFRKKADSFCRSVKGGAPFVVCSSCNQLLQLPPGKCAARKQNQVQCGSCSEVVTVKLKGMKVHPLIPSSSFTVLRSTRSSNRRLHQSSGWYPEQDDDSCSFNSQRLKQGFSDNLSRSSTASYHSTDKERVSNKSSQLKPVSTTLRSRFADSPKDILCQGDEDSQVEASAIRTIGPQAPILEDKLVDPFSNQQKDHGGGDQIKSKRYGLNCKGDHDVRVERIDTKYEQKSKEGHQDGFGEETINRTYGQKFKNMQKASSGDSCSLEDEAMSKNDEEKSKQDENNFRLEGVSKRYDNSNKKGYNDVLEVASVTKTSEEESIEDDYGKSLSTNCENANRVPKKESPVNERKSSSSRVSSEAGLDEIQCPAGKSGDLSFFGGLLKKGFKDLSLFNQSVDSVKVSINGHPISERALRKAEKKAGPVGPGSYWYDQRAGFWGVMGHECSGIIPPYIREFSYSMPKNCAGGSTGVLVNGRELHQKDFDLLVKRGLQRFTGKSYTVDISGNVSDDASGEKLRNLGKLAPTIEKMKRGFGMHVPEEKS